MERVGQVLWKMTIHDTYHFTANLCNMGRRTCILPWQLRDCEHNSMACLRVDSSTSVLFPCCVPTPPPTTLPDAMAPQTLGKPWQNTVVIQESKHVNDPKIRPFTTHNLNHDIIVYNSI